MHIKAIVSAAALAAALGLGTTAYAQTMIGGQTISEADMERVKLHCEDLQTAENQAAGAVDDDSEADDATEATETTGTPVDTDEDGTADETQPAEDAEDTDTAAVGALDMDAITLEHCKEAGFITSP